MPKLGNPKCSDQPVGYLYMQAVTLQHSKCASLFWFRSEIFHWHTTRKSIFQLDAYVVPFYGMLLKLPIVFSCGPADQKNPINTLLRIILPTFITVIIYKDNFFQKYIWRGLKNTMNSSQKCWPSLIIESYHNRGFRQAVIIILFLSASVRERITFSTSAKAFDNLQKTILKCRFCMLLLNCKQEHIKGIKRTVCTWKSHVNTSRKLIFQKSYFCSITMTKILQPPQCLKRKIIGDILGWCVCSSCLCTILPQVEEQAMAKTCLK